jgi:4-hydroxy-3-methylbut-2-en-1-yl diphosphate synthase IspG/GcpE
MGVSAPPEKEVASLKEMILQLTGTDITTCPCCGKGKMQIFAEIPKGRARPPSHLTCSVG